MASYASNLRISALGISPASRVAEARSLALKKASASSYHRLIAPAAAPAASSIAIFAAPGENINYQANVTAGVTPYRRPASSCNRGRAGIKKRRLLAERGRNKRYRRAGRSDASSAAWRGTAAMLSRSATAIISAEIGDIKQTWRRGDNKRKGAKCRERAAHRGDDIARWRSVVSAMIEI